MDKMKSFKGGLLIVKRTEEEHVPILGTFILIHLCLHLSKPGEELEEILRCEQYRYHMQSILKNQIYDLWNEDELLLKTKLFQNSVINLGNKFLSVGPFQQKNSILCLHCVKMGKTEFHVALFAQEQGYHVR